MGFVHERRRGDGGAGALSYLGLIGGCIGQEKGFWSAIASSRNQFRMYLPTSGAFSKSARVRAKAQ